MSKNKTRLTASTVLTLFTLLAAGLALQWMISGAGANNSAGQVATVDAENGWQSTGIELPANTSIKFEVTSGTWTHWSGTIGYNDGSGQDYICAENFEPQDCSEPLPGFNSGGLIGQVGDQIFGIGSSKTIILSASGYLYLRINDADRYLEDNDGVLTVSITTEESATATNTLSPAATEAATETPDPTLTLAATATTQATVAASPTSVATATSVATQTATVDAAETATLPPTATAGPGTATATVDATSTATLPPTATVGPGTPTATPFEPTATPVATTAGTSTPTAAATLAGTATPISPIGTATVAPTASGTPATPAPTQTGTITTTGTATPVGTVLATPTISGTAPITLTPTISVTPAITTTPTITVTPSITTTPTISTTPVISVTPTISTTTTPTPISGDITATPSNTPTPTPSQGSSVIFAEDGWQKSTIFIGQGQTCEIFVADGQWTHWQGVVPYNPGTGEEFVCAEKVDDPSTCIEPLPEYNKGALIGRVGESVFEIGNRSTVQLNGEGTLYMRINDANAGLFDNDGFLVVSATCSGVIEPNQTPTVMPTGTVLPDPTATPTSVATVESPTPLPSAEPTLDPTTAENRIFLPFMRQ
ncbi:MAG: hypothetical protein AAF633_11265 [Chloroflexota bacterium]